MTKLWIEWKTNGRLPTRSTVPWKSRKGGEIPTFPQLLRLLSHAQKTGEQKTKGCGKVEIQNQDSHFSTAPKACGARKVPAQHPFAPDACLLYTSRAHETRHDLVCRLLLEKK